MVLPTGHHPDGKAFAKAFERYLGETPHERIYVQALERAMHLPTFLARTYDPAGLSQGPVVEPRSLFAQFKDHPDERVSMAAERLLEDLQW